MPFAQPAKELHVLCHEHHVDMGLSQIAMMIEGDLSVAPAYACPRPDCFVHYATSHGYFIAMKHGQERVKKLIFEGKLARNGTGARSSAIFSSAFLSV